jgi:hypothetical protein
VGGGAAGNGLIRAVYLLLAFHTDAGSEALTGKVWHDKLEDAAAGGGGMQALLEGMTVSIHASAQVGFYTYGSLHNFSPFRRRTNYYALISFEEEGREGQVLTQYYIARVYKFVAIESAGVPPLRFALCSLYKATPRRNGLIYGIAGLDKPVKDYNPYLAPLSVIVCKVYMCGEKIGPASFARFSNFSAVLGGERLD